MNREAILDIDSDKWLEAMKSEIDSMGSNQAKLVAKGYNQRPRVDFEETYSALAMAKFIRILLAIAACILLIGNDVNMLGDAKAWLPTQFFMKDTGEELILKGYNDASFQSDDDDAKSQSGYVFKLNGGVVAWKSSK
ncbi:UNVERIFIED_CONTAM: hypothetical protein Scaly_0479800 [Sesamum calycinum]|uniref:Uncharacterized protein n=1 Tax=Sesamum calycinum TaxID=2727403 RepID=A0AAW2SG02_9LAMI